MIVGNGDIASVLTEVDKHFEGNVIFFASGVSDSKEERKEEFKREVDLLLKTQDEYKQIVYFSSLSVFYSDTKYTKHKLFMERVVKCFPSYTIIRIGNITWGDNPNTLINYLKAHPEAEIRDEYRYILDKEEFIHWMYKIPSWNAEMNITGKMMKVSEIKEQYGHA